MASERATSSKVSIRAPELVVAQQDGIAVEHLAKRSAVLEGEHTGHAAREILREVRLVPADSEGGSGLGDAAFPEPLAEIVPRRVAFGRGLVGIRRHHPARRRVAPGAARRHRHIFLTVQTTFPTMWASSARQV